MSFLDVTGLGTFWAKLKSTFQGPVSEVYKDILVPENLSYNCDFSRNGGYSTTLDYESLAGGNDIIICDGISLRSYHNSSTKRVNLTNLQITRSAGSLTVSGHAEFTDPSSSPDWTIRIQTPFLSIDDTTVYTLLGKFSNLSSSVNRCTAGFTGTNNIIYQNDNNTNYVRIVDPGAANRNLCLYVYTDMGDFSFTINGFACYQGEFKDPPYNKGWDLIPNTPLYNELNNPVFQCISFNRNSAGNDKWTRICKLGPNDLEGIHIISITNNVSSNFGNFVQFYISRGKFIQSFYLEVAHKFIGRYVSGGAPTGISSITGARIAADTNNNIYFEVKNKSTYFSNYFVSFTTYALCANHGHLLILLKAENTNVNYSLDGTSDTIFDPAQEITITY